MFFVAPPKALDDDDIEFLSSINEADKKRDRELKAQHDADLASFALAKETSSLIKEEPTKKRKLHVSTTTSTNTAQIASIKVHKKKKKKKEVNRDNTVVKTSGNVALVAACYGEDSE